MNPADSPQTEDEYDALVARLSARVKEHEAEYPDWCLGLHAPEAAELYVFPVSGNQSCRTCLDLRSSTHHREPHPW